MEGVPLCQQKSVGGDLFTPEIFNKKALFRMFLLVTEARRLCGREDSYVQAGSVT